MQQLHNMSIEQTIPKILKDKVYISITEFHLIQKDQYHHLQKETHI